MVDSAACPRWSWWGRVVLTLLLTAKPSSALSFTSLRSTETSLALLSSEKNFTDDVTQEEHCWNHLKTYFADMKLEKLMYQTGKCLESCGGELHLKSILNEWVRLSDSGISAVQCLLKVPELQNRVLLDTFWLTSSGDVLIYLGNSSDVVLTWDFLSQGQKTLEIMLLWIGLTLLLVVVLGNLLALATIVCNMNWHDSMWITRASLAFSDFLRGSFVMSMAIRNTLWLMTNTFQGPTASSAQVATGFPEYLCRSLAINTEYSSFCAILFETTSVMSFQCLAFLATERYLVCTYPQQRVSLNHSMVKALNGGMWGVGVILPLVILFTSQEPLGCGFFDPLTKLFILLPRIGVGYVLHSLLICYMAGLFIYTVLVLVKTKEIFIASSSVELANITTQSSPSRVEQRRREDHNILLTTKLMLALYLVSVSPRFLLLISGLRSEGRFLHLLFWWIFLLDASWHWYILNLRSQVFKHNLARLILRFPWWPRSVRATLESQLLPDAGLSVELSLLWQRMDSEISRRCQNLPA